MDQLKTMTYQSPHKYTRKELESLFVDDLMRDADSAERQAITGPFFPEKGITKESLMDYARECREKAAPKNKSRELSKIHLQFFTPGRDCNF